ncbi:MAG: hypothetical protein QOJ88_302 [Pyrinomonadaceae bacterium]|jgi:hypothetical protein|nr:hypothetical protein [Pyrinomonadaceae bacterium]
MKRFLATLALTCAFSGLALGADIPTCGVPAPASSGTETAPGEIATPGFTSPGDMGNGAPTVLLIILDLLF